ncbi:hypothetical protein JCM10450v2_001796 [Rhodotorula kratochvilovae]
MDAPREAERDGVAPRHRPPLAPAPAPAQEPHLGGTAADVTAPRGGALGAGAGEGSSPAQSKHNTRRRAGSLVNRQQQHHRGPSATPPPGRRTASPAATVAGAARRSSSPQVNGQQGGDAHNTRYASHRRPPPAASSASAQSPPLPSHLPPADFESVPPSATVMAARQWPTPANAPPGYRPASARPPLSRIPTFPLVDAYVPEANPSGRRHPRQLIPDDIGFPTPEMEGKIHPDDLEDRLLMATCAVMHAFENRALCPKEVAEVMLERGWLKNAGTTPFAHVSTCIRTHVQRATTSNPPYMQLLTPFELLGALTADEIRAVGLHAEQRPAVKRGTLWYLNPQVFGPGVGCDDPFVRCRREVGLPPSDQDGVYVRGLAPLQHAQASVPPALGLSSTLFSNVMAEEGEGEEGMGRGRRKRRASSAMMAAMGTSTTPVAPSPLGSGASTPVPVAVAIPSPRPATTFQPIVPAPPSAGSSAHRRTQSFAGPSSAPTKSSIPRLKLRLTALDESEGVDSDGHTGEAAEHRRKNKKKVRRAGSEGVSRAGSVDSSAVATDDDDVLSGASSSAFSSLSSSALLAQSLLAASTSGSLPPAALSLAPLDAVSPDSLSLANSGASFPFAGGRVTAPLLSVSAPNIFSHHFASAPSPPDVIMDSDEGDSSRPNTAAAALTPPSDSPSPQADEDDFHEAMLRGDDFEFEWGSESYTTAGTSSIEASVALAAADLAHAFSQQAKAEAPSAGGERDDAAVDTPATTPRSPGKELGEDEAAETPARRKAGEAIELVQGPLGTISRVGMSTTLCGEMAPASDDDGEDGDVVIVAPGAKTPSSTSPASDPPISAEALTNLAHDEPAIKDALTVPDLPHVSVPPPSPLPLDLSPILALTSAYDAMDFDFVGHEEAEMRSPFFRSASFADHDLAEDEDEDEEDDDIVTVKIEEEEAAMAVSSEPSSRASSAVPTFDSRLLVNVRAGSTGSSSSDSDGFDPMTFVSAPMLATGLPVPQPAPSPPETSDWSLSLDMLDDLDGEHTAVDLMAPETIGLEELDLAWAGDDEESGSPAPAPAKPAARPLNLTIPGRSASGAFLTGSTYEHSHRFTSPIPSPRRTSSSRVPVLGDFAKKTRTPVTPALSRTSSCATVFSAAAASPNKASASPVVMEPVIPLEPSVLATIVQRGVVVFTTNVTDLTTARTMPLLRRLDTDYVNATVLLQAAVSSPLERASTLASLLVKADTVRVPAASDAGVEGTWVPLAVARDVVALFAKQLGHLAPFLSDELAGHFPEPIPTMRNGLKAALEQKAPKDPNVAVLGSPCFDGAELLRRCGPPSGARSHSSTASRSSTSAPPLPPKKPVLAAAAVVPAPESSSSSDDEGDNAEDDEQLSTPPPVAATPVSTRSATKRNAATRTSRRTSVASAKAIAAAELQQSPPRRSSRRQSGVAK